MERNYYRWEYHQPMDYDKGFFSTGTLSDLFFYEQNGGYYEFFTGQFLGRKGLQDPNNQNSYVYVISDEFGAIIPLTAYS